MPDSSSLRSGAGAAPMLELLHSQLVSLAEDRRRIMLWSAVLVVLLLVVLPWIASTLWFLALGPLALLAVWNACLLVHQRRCEVAWDTAASRSEGGTTSRAAPKAISSRNLSAALSVGDIPELLRAFAAPSILVFHGVLLAVVTVAGVTQHKGRVSVLAESKNGGTAERLNVAVTQAPPGPKTFASPSSQKPNTAPAGAAQGPLPSAQTPRQLAAPRRDSGFVKPAPILAPPPRPNQLPSAAPMSPQVRSGSAPATLPGGNTGSTSSGMPR